MNPKQTRKVNLAGGQDWTVDVLGVNKAKVDTTGTNTLALFPLTSDGGAVGSTSLMWSDIFLADGGVINWNNGSVTLTEATGSLTLAGADYIITHTGSNTNSKKLQLISNNGGTLQTASLQTMYGADPYLRLSVPNDSGVETSIIDYHDTVMAFVTDNTVDIGASGANRPKNLFLSGNSNVAGNSTISGAQTVKVTDVNAATYDLTTSDYILSVSYTGTGAVTSLTLPTAQMISGRVIVVKDAGLNASVNNITIDTEGAEKIDGQDTYVMSSDGESITLFATATGWYII